MPATVRPRRADDAEALFVALGPVHERDGYPLHAHHLTPTWLFDGVDVAWVAEAGDRVVGHIGLVPDDAAGTRETWHVTRFFVAVDGRGTGAGTALLAAAESWADGRSAGLALDVVEHNTDAQRLYESRGWVRTGTVVADWVRADPPWPDAFTYARPAPDSASGAVCRF